MTVISLIDQRTPNRSALQSEITTSAAITTNLRWTSASWNTFVTRKNDANTVNSNVHATQAQIDTARLNLYNARAGLVLQTISLSFTGSWSGQTTHSARDGYCAIYGSGTLTLNTKVNKIEISIFGGGGGGGGTGTSDYSGSGGGGGGYHHCRKTRNGQGYDGAAFAVNAGSYTVSIGGGGAGGVGYQNNGGSGGTTSVFGRSAAGGAGGNRGATGIRGVGGAGGSGGGGCQLQQTSGSQMGVGGINGANGQDGNSISGRINAGGAGSGRNMTPFHENGWWTSTAYCPGGCGGVQNGFQSGQQNTKHGWSGWQWGGAPANTGGGGGGVSYYFANPGTGTAGGSGMIFIRWYD